MLRASAGRTAGPGRRPSRGARRPVSRAIEARADAFSLQATGQADAFISFERRITLRNLSDPDPPRWLTFLLATHPPAIKRIGMGVAYEQSRK